VQPGRGTVLVVVPPRPELLERLLEALHVERELRHKSLHHLAQSTRSGSVRVGQGRGSGVGGRGSGVGGSVGRWGRGVGGSGRGSRRGG
jgi:hypothetical protein